MCRLAHFHRAMLLFVASLPCQSDAADAQRPVEFNRDIRPILSNHCFACHGPDRANRQAELRLDIEAGAKAALASAGHAIVPGKSHESQLYRRITAADAETRMPPESAGKPLSQAQIETLKTWIDQGASWQPHWSLIPPKRSVPPATNDMVWPRGAIDRFLLARLEREGLTPSPEADRVTLIRRLSLDLTGLPPNAAEVAAFVNDASPNAYEVLADRLLASPHYGERMATFWLDLVRYADTVGYHGDQEHPISPYRDYVIHAFNQNMPFGRFTIEQLAGDLLPNPTTEQRIATGYNRLLQTSHEGGVQKKEYLAKYSADRVRNFSSVWLGGTMGCAECHDHKFDPFTQRDFYSLAAFFADVNDDLTFKGGDTTPTKREPELVVASPLDKAPRRTMITMSIEPRPIRVLHRGDWMDETGPIVEPAVPHHLPQIKQPGRPSRLHLAEWLIAPENPLTARVFVNRLWKLFYGKGIAARLDDLGSQGESPVHPELLDWLAVEFVESGWDVKHLVRLLVTSQAYRQASLDRRDMRKRDPENRLIARQSRWRLEAEFIRDNALAVSGLLVRDIGGPSARPYQPAGYYEFLNFPKRDYKADAGPGQYRRGLYMHWQRVFLHPMLKAFDAPSREECTAERSSSNTPTAALVLLNDTSFVEAARVLAARAIREGGMSFQQRLDWIWQTCLSRAPSPREAEIARQLFERDLPDYRGDQAAARQLLSIGQSAFDADLDIAEAAAWTSLARVLFNLNEFIMRE